jgi:subtilisin family serine protease
VASAATAAASSAADGDVIADEYIVTFRDDVADAPGLARQMAAQHGASLRFTYSAAIRGFAAHMSARAAEAIRRNPMVHAVEADMVARVTDVQQPAPWNLDRIDQRTLPIDRSYTYPATGAGVNVYIIDSGIRTTHAELGGRAFGAFTVINDGRGTGDCSSHGTHVAGIVGGTQFGVAKAAKLFAVRVFGCTGVGATSGVIAGVDWVTRNRSLPAVATMSLSGSKSESLNLAVQNSIKAGVVYAVAAGNGAADACGDSPASTPEAITVGASSNSDGISGYSNFGPCVDVFAPGDAIRSAYITDDTSTVLKGGTSMATPHAAGVAALYLSVNPGATPAQVSEAIVAGATTGVLKNATSGSPNRVLFTGVLTMPPATAVPAPVDSAAPPTPVPPPAPDQLPVARFTFNCVRGTCTYDAAASSDDRGIAMYSWDFGDGSAPVDGSSAVRVSHTYRSVGKYTVTLRVTDAAGQRGSFTSVANVRRF